MCPSPHRTLENRAPSNVCLSFKWSLLYLCGFSPRLSAALIHRSLDCRPIRPQPTLGLTWAVFSLNELPSPPLWFPGQGNGFICHFPSGLAGNFRHKDRHCLALCFKKGCLCGNDTRERPLRWSALMPPVPRREDPTVQAVRRVTVTPTAAARWDWRVLSSLLSLRRGAARFS